MTIEPPAGSDSEEVQEAGSKATDQLEAEIAITRQRVADGIEAIAERFSSDAIKRQVKSSLQRRGVAVVQLAREHPLATALLGLSLIVLTWKWRGRRA